MRYFHGGVRGLEAGGYILPPSETKTKDTLLSYAAEYCAETGITSPQRADRVYVATEFNAAAYFSAMHPRGGWVYEVEPEGALERDPDCFTPGLSYQCPKARIILVHRLTKSFIRKVRRAALEAG